MKLGSIKAALQKPSITKTEDRIAEKEPENVASKPLNVPAVKALFKDFSGVLVQEKRASLAACLADPLCAIEGNKITLTVASKSIENNIAEFENRIRREFAEAGYGDVQLGYDINVATVSEYKMFTPQQQFDAMVKKNPKLEDFKQRFQLTFDE